MEGLILLEGFCGVGEISFGCPRVFFGQISFPSDQEGTVSWCSLVAQDPVNFIFFFFCDKVRQWFLEIWTMYGIFTIGR